MANSLAHYRTGRVLLKGMAFSRSSPLWRGSAVTLIGHFHLTRKVSKSGTFTNESAYVSDKSRHCTDLSSFGSSTMQSLIIAQVSTKYVNSSSSGPISSSNGKIPFLYMASRAFSSIASHSESRKSPSINRCITAVINRQFSSENGQNGVMAHQLSLENPEKFWSEAANDIKWFNDSENHLNVLDSSNPPFYRWFKGRKMNTCYNCLDRHIKDGMGDKLALIYDSPVTNTIRRITFNETLQQVTKLAHLLSSEGIQKGDRVLIYMPNIPESVIAMLACSRVGAIHSVVFGGFAAPELATRIRDCKPKMIISTSVGIDGSKKVPYKPLLDKAIELVKEDHIVPQTIIYQRDIMRCDLIPGRDIDGTGRMNAIPDSVDVPCVPLDASDPLYILYTSGMSQAMATPPSPPEQLYFTIGTTGKPKGVLRDNGGHAVALKWAMTNIFDVRAGEVFWAASDVGWVVGHSFMVYGPLLQGCATVIYEGKPVGTPDASNFWRTMERHQVVSFFTAPTALRAMKREDRVGDLARQFNLNHLRSLFLAGEHADKDTIHWAEHNAGVPVIDNWWQTETGWPICANALRLDGKLPVKYGSCFRPTPGYNLQVLDDNHKPLPAGSLGNLAIKLPLPPGSMLTLYNSDERYIESYMTNIPGYYDTGDAGLIDEDGYVYVMARTDDVINVAGHRLSTGAMEEVLSEHPDIAEAAVVGIKDKLKGQIPLGLLVLTSKCSTPEQDIINDVINMVREQIGPVAFFKKAVIVSKLPKTRSGKVLRSTLRSIANKETVKIPATIEDLSAIDEAQRVIDEYRND